MTEPAKRWTMPWGPLLTLAALASLIAGLLRLGPGTAPAAPWDVVAWSVLAGAATFLAMRWMQNDFWGLIAALVLTRHPLFWQWAEPFPRALQADAVELAMMAVAMAGWRWAYRPDFAWPGWLVIVALGVVLGATAWETEHACGIATNALVLVAFPLGALFGLFRYWQGGEERPCPGNLACAFFSGGAILGAGVILASLRTDGQYVMTSAFWRESLNTVLPSLKLRGFGSDQLSNWCWPHAMIVLPLMAWGLLRSLWRGWRQLRRRQAPTAWLLSLFTAAVVFQAAMSSDTLPAATLVALASLSMLLAVFGMADIFRGISERLILLPPAERYE